MSTKTLLSLATIAFFAATAKADSISAGESSDSWFAVDASEANISGSGWTGPVSGFVEVSTTIDVDTAATDPLKYALPGNKLSATSIRIDGTIASLTRNATTPGDDVFSTTVPQAAMIASDDDGMWHLWHCTDADAEAGEWVTSTATAPADAATDVHVAIEFKSGYVRYGTVSGGTTTWLTDDAENPAGWLSNAKNYSNIARVGLAGYGSFGDFGGLVVKAITIDTSKVPTDTYGAIDGETNLSSYKKAGDKLTIGQALILGMANPSDDPIPAPVQTDDGDLGFTISNANVGAYGDSSYATLEVYEVDAPNADISEASPTATGTVGNTVKIPAKSSGVKYYKTKIIFH